MAKVRYRYLAQNFPQNHCESLVKSKLFFCCYNEFSVNCQTSVSWRALGSFRLPLRLDVSCAIITLFVYLRDTSHHLLQLHIVLLYLLERNMKNHISRYLNNFTGFYLCWFMYLFAMLKMNLNRTKMNHWWLFGEFLIQNEQLIFRVSREILAFDVNCHLSMKECRKTQL